MNRQQFTGDYILFFLQIHLVIRYEAMQETAYLLQSPENARRLLKSLHNADKNKGVAKSLKDLADA